MVGVRVSVRVVARYARSMILPVFDGRSRLLLVDGLMAPKLPTIVPVAIYDSEWG